MNYRTLGNTGIEVSVICLGTMTWGEQNTEAEAHEQLDFAVEQGVNFIDTAEMYPVPPREETQGLTETHTGNWLKRHKNRGDLILASKVSGPDMQSYLRGGPELTRDHIERALEGSLQRLGTDCIDLYQVHWPARKTNFFGKLGYQHEDDAGDPPTPISETLEALGDLVAQGKVRHIGISNETPWGAMAYLALSGQSGGKPALPRIVSIQNPYSLLNRTFEVGLAEIAHREQCGLLAYSPLGFGVLSGKYLDGAKPANARLTLFEYFTRYTGEAGIEATRRYVEIARGAGLDPAQMALAYVNTRSFLTSNIIGATTMEQLKSNIESARLELSVDVLEAIERVHEDLPNPCP